MYLQEIENYVGSMITKETEDFTDEEMVNIDELVKNFDELVNNLSTYY